MRATLGATLAVLGAVGALAAGTHAAKADAAPDTFTVVSAGATAGTPDQVTVVVDSPTTSTISTLSAGFVTGGSDVYDTTLTAGASVVDPNDSSQTQTTYTSGMIPWGTSPTTGLPLGTGYSISVAATFSDSATPVTVTDAGSYNFLATSKVALTAGSMNLGPGDASTTLSGQVTLTNPDGTPDTDLSSVTSVTIQSGSTTIEPLAVNSTTGDFSDPTFAPSATETIDAALAGTTTVSGSVSAPVTIVVSVTPGLKLTQSSVADTYGKSFTVSGTLSATAGSVSGQQIWINTTQSATGALATTTTGDAGGFTLTVPTRPSGGTLYVGSASGTGLTASVAVPLTLKVVHPTEITGFKSTLSQYWVLSVSGCVGFPATDKTEKITHTSGLMVQWAPPGGTWRKLGSINANEADHGCGTNGIEFSGSYTAPENYAYYRVVYSGTTGATSFAASTGPSQLSWRYADRIADFKVSPTVVNAGGKLTISGVLQYYYSGWHNYSGQQIVIYLHPKGSNPTWYWLVKINTNSKGQFSATFKDPVSATWEAAFEGNAKNGVGHLSTGSSEVYVRLK